MAVVRMGFFLGVALVASSCKVYDRDLLGGCPPNTIGCLPDAPADRSEADGGASISAVWALTDIDLNQENDAWANLGLNLDHIVSSGSNPHQGCIPATDRGVPGDGTNGIDNAYGQFLFPAIVQSSVPHLTEQLCCWQRRGRGTVLVRVDDWNGTKNDPKLRLSVLYAVDGTTDADSTVQWDSATEHGLMRTAGGFASPPSWAVAATVPPMSETRWWVDPVSYIGGDPTTPLFTDSNAWAKDGFVVMRIPADQPVALMIGDDTGLDGDHGRGGSLKITLQGAFAWAQLSDDFSRITDGGIAGRLGKNQLLSVSQSIGVCVPMSVSNGIIDTYGDVNANPADDELGSSTCNAISMGTKFKGVRGSLATSLAGESLCYANSCGGISCPPLGSDHGQCGNSTTPVVGEVVCPPLP